MEKRQIIRPREGRIFFGVAAAIANYVDIDVVIVRIIFVILAIWGGSGILLYIIGIFLIPEEKGSNSKKEVKEKIEERVQSVAHEVKTTASQKGWRMQGSQIFGLIIIVIGLIFILQNFFSWWNWGRLWPILLIFIGLIILVSKRKELK